MESFKKSYLTLLSIILCTSFFQVANCQNISRRQADSLIYKFRREKTDISKFSLLLKLANFQIAKPGELKPDLDSAKTYLYQAQLILPRLHSTETTGQFELESFYYFKEADQNKLSQEALDKAILFLKKGNDKVSLGMAYRESAYRIYNIPPNIPSKIHLLQLSIAAYEATTDKRDLGDSYRLLADTRMIYYKDENALPELDSAKQLYIQAKSGDWQQLYILYSKFYSHNDNNKKALDAILTALRITLAGDSSSEVSELNHHAANLFTKMKEYKNALLYDERALAIAEKNNQVEDIYEIVSSITAIYTTIGKPKIALNELIRVETKYPTHRNEDLDIYDCLAKLNIYNALREYSNGRFYYDYFNNQFKNVLDSDDGTKSLILGEMIPYCIGSGQYKRAEYLLKIRTEATKGIPSPIPQIIKNLTFWVTLDTTRKDFKSAANHLLQLKKINDSVFSETETKQQKEMEVQYETELKDKENKLQKQQILTLNGQQQLERAALKSAQTTRNITLLSGLGIIIIAGLIYRQYTQGRKNNVVIKNKNKRLEHLLSENEWLLKEVHHRVKNNLQIITSLLSSQSKYLNDEVALNAIADSQHRVRAMSLIHQKLYMVDNTSTIFMSDYLHELITYLKDSFKTGLTILFDVDISPITIDLAYAVPIGLIVNEVVTNAIKHAFPHSGDHKITIKLYILDDNNICLSIADNGIGLPVNYDIGQSDSFGMVLIKGMVEDLNGVLHIVNDNGTKINIAFSKSS